MRSFSLGPFSQYLSPAKGTFPSLREPASQTFLFPSTPSMKPPIQYHNPSFTTPQKPIEFDFSSGPENQSSPGNADNEDTPEVPRRSGISKVTSPIIQFAGNKSEKKHGAHASSGRGEIARKLYTDAIPRRVQKRRRREAERDMRIALHQGPSYDTDSDSRSRPSSQEGGTLNQKQQAAGPARDIGIIPSIFTFIEKHPNLPHILSYYAQFLLNVFLVFFMMYLVYSFWSTIRSDVDLKSREVASETLAEMAVCAREFKENRCDRTTRVPAMEAVCDNWEKCMKQDPTKVGRARVSANTFAEILNNFIEPISAKTMVSRLSTFGCFSLFLLVYIQSSTSYQPNYPQCWMTICRLSFPSQSLSTNIYITDRLLHPHLRLLRHLQHDPHVLPQQDPHPSPSAPTAFAIHIHAPTSLATNGLPGPPLLHPLPEPDAEHGAS